MTHPLNIDTSEFPIAENLTYVNHAGTAPIPKRSADSLKVYADEVSGFASSIYGNWTARLNKTRAAASELLACDIDEVARHRLETWRCGDRRGAHFSGELDRVARHRAITRRQIVGVEGTR